MKRKKDYQLISLLKLSLSYVFKKSSIIIFVTILVLMTITLIIFSNPWDEFLTDSQMEYVNSYLNQALFIVQIFNSILIATTVILLLNHSQNFDILFVAYVPRNVLGLIKVLSAAIVALILSVLEIIIIFIVCYIRFDSYSFSVDIFFSILFLYLGISLETAVSYFFSAILVNILTPMAVLFLFVIARIIFNNYFTTLHEWYKYVPLLEISNNSIDMSAYIYVIVYIFIFRVLFISIFEGKSLQSKE